LIAKNQEEHVEKLKSVCPDCLSRNLTRHTVYNTRNYGQRWIYRCADCGRYFSEARGIFLHGIRKPIQLILHVIKARAEGMGVNATARVFGVSKNTLIDWEHRFSAIKVTLLVYALLHQFLHLVIEGDEVYTRVGKNVWQEESRGWTMVLMDRAGRFLGELRCGRKDRKLFRRALRTLCRLIDKTRDLSLITDGERRYGRVLFEICHELTLGGKRVRPAKTLKRGVKVRLKNKGSQAHKRGRKRPKYEAPVAEHSGTVQDIENRDIHANHVESFNSSLRRRCSAFRRRTNTYAKRQESLQRALDVHWVVHNFVRPHFTTRMVPAVALGILDRGLSWVELFTIPIASISVSH
jgi:transposase-like protein